MQGSEAADSLLVPQTCSHGLTPPGMEFGGWGMRSGRRETGQTGFSKFVGFFLSLHYVTLRKYLDLSGPNLYNEPLGSLHTKQLCPSP